MFPSIGLSVFQQRISFSSPLRTGHTRPSADFLKPLNYQIPNLDHNIPFRCTRFMFWYVQPVALRDLSQTRRTSQDSWMSDQPVAETSTWQRTVLTIDILAPGGIRTRNPSKSAAADLRLRLAGPLRSAAGDLFFHVLYPWPSLYIRTPSFSY